MKVLQINKLYAPWLGGVETHVRQVSELLTTTGEWEVDVLCARSFGWASKSILNGVRIHRALSLGMLAGSPVSPFFPWHLWRLARKADLLHFHLPNPLAVISWLVIQWLLPRRCRKHIPIVVTWHSDIIRQKRFLKYYRPLLLRFLHRVNVILATSPIMKTKSAFLSRFSGKVLIVPLSINLETYQNTAAIENYAQRIHSAYGNHILFVGRLVYYKGIMVLLEALKSLDTALLIIGNGPLKDEVNQFASDHLKPNQVTVLPPQPVEQLLAHFSQCDCLVLPSTEPAEAFGIVQLEAMAFGKAVISTDLPTGVPYVNQHNATGLVVPPDNPEALAAAIKSLAENSALAQRLGKSGRHRVSTHFSDKVMLEKILQIYHNLSREN